MILFAMIILFDRFNSASEPASYCFSKCSEGFECSRRNGDTGWGKNGNSKGWDFLRKCWPDTEGSACREGKDNDCWALTQRHLYYPLSQCGISYCDEQQKCAWLSTGQMFNGADGPECPTPGNMFQPTSIQIANLLQKHKPKGHVKSSSGFSKPKPIEVKKKSIFEDKTPKSRYDSSQYLKVMVQSNDITITTTMIQHSLPLPVQHKLNKKMFMHWTDLSVWIWTTNSEFEETFRSLTESLYADDKDTIKKYMPIMMGINWKIRKPMQSTMTTYRSSWMSDKHFSNFEIGSTYRCPAFVASSKMLKVALEFAGTEKKYMIEFHIPKGINAMDITHLSAFEDEGEILLPPYTPFRVFNIRYNDKNGKTWLYVEVLIDEEVDMDVPSVFL